MYRNGYNDVVGLLFTKDLIFVDPEDATSVEQFITIFGRRLLTFWHEDSVSDVFHQMKEAKSHFGLVRGVEERDEGDPQYVMMGICTMEDIIEEIIQDEIIDETDVYVDVRSKSPTSSPEPRLSVASKKSSYHAAPNAAEIRKSSSDEKERIKVPGRDNFDYAKLRLLDPQLCEEPLTEPEIIVLAQYLGTIPQIRDVGLSDVGLRELISDSHVVNWKRKTHEMHANVVDEDFVYKRGEPSDKCTIVLTGKLSVLAGVDKFISDAGSFTVLGADALVQSSYKPDFSAYVATEKVRCVVLSRHFFQSHVGGGDGNAKSKSSGANSHRHEGQPSSSRKSAFSHRLSDSFDEDLRSPEVPNRGSKIRGRGRILLKTNSNIEKSMSPDRSLVPSGSEDILHKPSNTSIIPGDPVSSDVETPEELDSKRAIFSSSEPLKKK